MKAADVFLMLDRAGLSVSVQGARLVVQPATLLTNDLRRLAWDYKAGLMALARDAEERAALAVANARLAAGEVRRVQPADGGRS